MWQFYIFLSNISLLYYFLALVYRLWLPVVSWMNGKPVSVSVWGGSICLLCAILVMDVWLSTKIKEKTGFRRWVSVRNDSFSQSYVYPPLPRSNDFFRGCQHSSLTVLVSRSGLVSSPMTSSEQSACINKIQIWNFFEIVLKKNSYQCMYRSKLNLNTTDLVL